MSLKFPQEEWLAWHKEWLELRGKKGALTNAERMREQVLHDALRQVAGPAVTESVCPHCDHGYARRLCTCFGPAR